MFSFKQFDIDDSACAMKVCTDSVLLGAWASLSAPGESLPRHILDAGAGSGILSLMLAQRMAAAGAECAIEAVEIDSAAAECARGNVGRSPWRQAVTVTCADVLCHRPESAADLVISNPPYFSQGLVSPQTERALARHGDSAFGPLSLIGYAAEVLSAAGTLAMVTPADDSDRIIYAAEMHRLCLWRRCQVSTVEGRPPTRVLWQFGRRQYPVDTRTLAVRLARGGMTDECAALTSDFYL